MPKGAFTVSLGPDFTLPVHKYFHQRYNLNSTNIQEDHGHQKFSTDQTGQKSSMGIDFKMGYEKQLGKNMSINVGPDFNIYQLVQFHSNHAYYFNRGYTAYQYYLGLDVALNFGIGK